MPKKKRKSIVRRTTLGEYYVKATCPGEHPHLEHNESFSAVYKKAVALDKKGCKIVVGWEE
jgi:hypothetical protein